MRKALRSPIYVFFLLDLYSLSVVGWQTFELCFGAGDKLGEAGSN